MNNYILIHIKTGKFAKNEVASRTDICSDGTRATFSHRYYARGAMSLWKRIYTFRPTILLIKVGCGAFLKREWVG